VLTAKRARGRECTSPADRRLTAQVQRSKKTQGLLLMLFVTVIETSQKLETMIVQDKTRACKTRPFKTGPDCSRPGSNPSRLRPRAMVWDQD